MADIQHLASLTEEDIKFRYITPAIESAGWQKNQIRMEYFFTDGRIISAGSEYERASRKKADYVASSPSIAGALILGRNTNGWTRWKDANGKTLDEVYRQK